MAAASQSTGDSNLSNDAKCDYFVEIPVLTDAMADTTELTHLLTSNYQQSGNDIGSIESALEYVTHHIKFARVQTVFSEQFKAQCLLLTFDDHTTCNDAYSKLASCFQSVFYVEDLSKFEKQWICQNCNNQNSIEPKQTDNNNTWKCTKCEQPNKPSSTRYTYSSSLPVIHHSQSKHQLRPLVNVHIDATNTTRPLHFGESILDALGEFAKHELIVTLRETPPANKSQKPTVVISKHSANFEATAEEEEKEKSVIPVLNTLIDKTETKANEQDTYQCILGHSQYSPVRRLKQYILTQENANKSDMETAQQHAQYLEYLPKYVDAMAFPKLATVMILMDSEQNILLTRRHAKLRSFPSCFVVPGGSVDAGECMADAAKRELFEEVGINLVEESAQKVDNMYLIAIWESIYPDSKRYEVVDNHSIKYHHIVPIYVCQLNAHFSTYKLKLDEVEVDCALWVNVQTLKEILQSDDGADLVGDNKKTLKGIKPNGDECVVSMQCLQGIYPNKIGQGIARGHRYGINKLMQRL